MEYAFHYAYIIHSTSHDTLLLFCILRFIDDFSFHTYIPAATLNVKKRWAPGVIQISEACSISSLATAAARERGCIPGRSGLHWRFLYCHYSVAGYAGRVFASMMTGRAEINTLLSRRLYFSYSLSFLSPRPPHKAILPQQLRIANKKLLR